ncbi:MAG: lysoplasmalogenase [Chitinophagales bacterium]|nr:lysoplasmalogenase [Chitinophagales bacterium]
MKNRSQFFISAYMLVAIFHIFSLATHKKESEIISKLLLMPMLAGYVLMECKGYLRMCIPLLAGLFFSWIGDIILIKSQNAIYFVFGLTAFLCAHIAYIITFRNFRFTSNDKKISQLYIIPFLVYAAAMLVLVYPNLGDMKVPVIIYSTVISLMGIAALLRKENTSDYSFLFCLAGAISFIISDSLIAVNKFYSSFASASLFIMLTYIIAQYLIAAGCILHLRQLKEE